MNIHLEKSCVNIIQRGLIFIFIKQMFMKLFNSIKKISLFLLTFFIIDFSPNIINEVQPDSGSYLNLNPTRQTLYYLIINALDGIGID